MGGDIKVPEGAPDPRTVMVTQADLDSATTSIHAAIDGLRNTMAALAELGALPARVASLETLVADLRTNTPTSAAAPRNLRASITARTVTLMWTPPQSGPPTGYVVEAGHVTGGTDVTLTAIPPAPTTWQAVNVAKGRYYARVRAVYATGQSDPSNEIVVDVV
jgi:enamine deaminase RidA (YjgF/YER057c/UK114 family)